MKHASNHQAPEYEAATVLVTGGAGFIGSHVVDALLDAGYSVRVLDDLSNGTLDNLPMHDPGLSVRVGDLLDYRLVAEAMQDVHYCIHLAAQVSVARSLEAPLESATCNILGFINILEACRDFGVQRLLYASSAAVYGDPRQLPLDEDVQCEPLSPYGLEKFIDEAYASLYARLYGLRTLGLRFFNVYGPRQDPHSPYSGVISRFIERVASGRPPLIYGDGKQTRDYIHVEDVARACLSALDSAYCGVCNVSAGVPANLLDLVTLLGEVLEQDIHPEFDAPRMGDIPDSYADPLRMRQELGCQSSVSLADGLAELMLARCPRRVRIQAVRPARISQSM